MLVSQGVKIAFIVIVAVITFVFALVQTIGLIRDVKKRKQHKDKE